MANDTYAVIEFVDERSVEVVVESWIETCDGVGFHLYSVLLVFVKGNM